MKAKRDHGGCILPAVNPEYPALFAQFVIVKGVGGQHGCSLLAGDSARPIGRMIAFVFIM
jgi:hypothetical protein